MTESKDIETRLAQLESRVEELEEENEKLRQENKELRERVEDLEDQPEIAVEDESDPIGTLTVDDAPLGRAIKSKVSEQDLENELDELEGRLGDVTPTPETEKTASPTAYEPETPLEQVVALPESMVEEQLSSNQDRARFIARDVREYGKKTGTKKQGHSYAIDSTTLRKVLKASYNISHTETINRIIEWLDKMGKDETFIRTTNGKRKVIFEGELVKRIEKAKRVSENHSRVMNEQEA